MLLKGRELLKIHTEYVQHICVECPVHLQLPEKSAGSTLTLKAHMNIFPSSKVTRIHTMGASRALWIMAENRYLQDEMGAVFVL